MSNTPHAEPNADTEQANSLIEWQARFILGINPPDGSPISLDYYARFTDPQQAKMRFFEDTNTTLNLLKTIDGGLNIETIKFLKDTVDGLLTKGLEFQSPDLKMRLLELFHAATNYLDKQTINS